ncbi:MAG: hypothetical protein EOS81_29705 [Mesorhizobium sp.]|uniref:hypothetical protein n=1 Tax=unclassified Mesorhizobium TaxID=325217 RepID=UPI000F760E49|nr:MULTISPECIES: hypothetical protein [unclassified Mesorhizobium]RVC68952.1 hypothetical protein EN759_09885 [Mesorhizobium sp. M00.F.Ca.ET.038.03.1.1]RVC77709.1 hypothetical protein EN766_10995 [Mesorhizobium sp. M2A.F.Ca.ET.046.02.1.1]AZO36314.1 hypothetical protein EJ072_19225 [Mesorhizobium sp. M2A.F.Ca.ET.046.03.2.1]RWB39886.1 MAG: hypothetical protein EOQ44_26855 [Mesorhizobium sp.]RWE14898.1 MAG: hypothetical protein EOS76_24145 [Mesorhizobium sp.]
MIALDHLELRSQRERPDHPDRYDDPNPTSLLAFLVEGFRRANEMVAPSPWAGPVEIDPSYLVSIRNVLTDLNAFAAVIDHTLRTKALALMAAAGVSGAAAEPVVDELVRGWRYQQVACELLAKDRTISQSKYFSPAARVIASVTMLLESELGAIKPTPLYGETASLLNLGIPKNERGLKGRHMRAGVNRWKRDLLAAVNRRRRDCIAADDFIRLELQYITGTVRGLLVLWQQAPGVERFKRAGRGAALARSIDEQDCISYRIGKTDDQPLSLRKLYDCRR